MKRKFLGAFLFVAVGLAVGVMFAKFTAKDYKHASIAIKRGEKAKPLYINNYGGKQVLALSVKNLQHAKDIEVKADGIAIQSWYPPVVRMPFFDIDFKGGRFSGVAFGKRLPLYLIFDDGMDHKDIEIINSSDGTLIQTVHVMRGRGEGGHH
ncbi:MAG: hypothetical protein HY756_03630 [Nitrospirae bacterium]|nr:hypothetical protein [Nitrospirota bacterium]